MNKKSGTSKDAADRLVKNIPRKTRRLHSAAYADGPDARWLIDEAVPDVAAVIEDAGVGVEYRSLEVI